MVLWEVTNGSVGESYVRCYVWTAAGAESAIMMCSAKHGAGEYKARRLFDVRSVPFCTNWSDSGWPEE